MKDSSNLFEEKGGAWFNITARVKMTSQSRQSRQPKVLSIPSPHLPLYRELLRGK